ncbi:MAG: hypothetical protein JXR56_01990 [Candidatus Cloacimonetes bacterium]|nr:hypothetical protein [Candidatus Cloacimonadota bacterium]
MQFKDDLKLLDDYTRTKNKAEFDKLIGRLRDLYTSDGIEKVELILKQLTFDFTFEYNFKKLEPQFEEVESVILEYGNQLQKIRFLSNQGIIKTQLHKLDAALNCHKKALEYCTGPETNNFLMGIQSNIGAIFNMYSNFREALKHFLQAYIYSQKYNQNELNFIYRLLTNIGVTYLALNDNTNAIYYFNTALETVLDNDVSVPLSLLYNNLALAYINNSDFENAQICLDKFNSLPFDKPKHFEITHNRVLGEFYFCQGMYREALDTMLKYIDDVKSEEQRKEQFEYSLTIAKCYLKLGDAKEAKAYLDNLDKLDNSLTNLKLLDLKADYYKLTGDFKTALDYARKQNLILSKSYNELQNSSVEDLTNMLRSNQDNIAVSAYQEKLMELNYLNYELNGQKDLLLSNLNTLKEEKALRDKMISIITHDVRGPIGNASQLLNMLSIIETPEEKEEIILSLTEAVTNTYTLTDNLVSWARDVISGIDESLTNINVYQCVEELKELYKTQLNNKSIRILNNLSYNSIIKGEIMSINTIFRNVIQNAIKYSFPNSSITISDEAKDKQISFFIKDSGIGMTPEKVDSLFDSSSFSTMGTEQEKGTGLGLLLVKELVHKNSGSIVCSSEPDKGTVFEITFPTPE